MSLFERRASFEAGAVEMWEMSKGMVLINIPFGHLGAPLLAKSNLSHVVEISNLFCCCGLEDVLINPYVRP